MSPLNALIDYDESERLAGHKRRYRWRTRRVRHDGPRQPRHVAVVEIEERFDPKFSVTIPKHYHYKWWLECGHRTLPATRMDADSRALRYSDPARYEDPETYIVYCVACQRALDTWEEERYKEYYWEAPHKEHMFCPSCRACLICRSHAKNCLEPTREYLMECIFECISSIRNEIDDIQRDELYSNVRAVVDTLTKRQLGEAIQPYVED